jgi:hypothetical protein
MKRAVACYDKEGWKATQHNFRRIKQRKYIYSFRDYIEQQGTKSDKLLAINEFVHQKFNEAINKRLIVHEKDLKRWAILKKREVGLSSFVASHFWLISFKRKYRIVSRKITKYVSMAQIEDSASIMETARNFVESAISKFEEYSSNHILNTDQSGFTYLEHSSYTLANVGQKSVVATLSSVSATTHSYTIQPTISLSGSII